MRERIVDKMLRRNILKGAVARAAFPILPAKARFVSTPPVIVGASGVPPPPPLQGTIHHVPASSRDQTSLVQNTINAAVPGDTIFFDSGMHVIYGTIIPRRNLLYIGPTVQFNGQARAVLQFSDGNHVQFQAGVNNCTIYGLTFLRTEIDFVNCSAITFTNNIFDGHGGARFPNTTLHFFPGGFNIRTQWNTFLNMPNGGAIWTYNPNNMTVTHNYFKNIMQSISITNEGAGGNNNIITFNYIGSTKRFSIEVAESSLAAPPSTGWLINDNYAVGKPGISIVAAGTPEIARNFIDRTVNGADFGGIEFQCRGTGHIHDNYVRLDASATGLVAGIYGSYDATDTSLVQNNNLFNCDTNVPAYSGGLAVVSGTTHNDLGMPPIPMSGAGP